MSKIKFVIALALVLSVFVVLGQKKAVADTGFEWKAPRISQCQNNGGLFWQNPETPNLTPLHFQADGKLINPWEPIIKSNLVVPAGEYNIEAYSYDGYKDRHFQNQANESYYLVFRSVATDQIIFQSSKTTDVPDPADKDWAEITTTFSNIQLTEATKLEFVHIGGEGPGSLLPLDVCFKKSIPLPTCSLSTKIIDANNRIIELNNSNNSALQPKSRMVDFGDNQTIDTLDNTISHTYTKDGKYTIRVKYVYDYYGEEKIVECSTEVEVKKPFTTVDSATTTNGNNVTTAVAQTTRPTLADTGSTVHVILTLLIGSIVLIISRIRPKAKNNQ